MRHVFHLFSLALILTLGHGLLSAQGAAASFLRQPFVPEEAARAGAYTTVLPTPLTIFSNCAALPLLNRPAVSIGYTHLQFAPGVPQDYAMLGVGSNLGEFGGIGLGVATHSIGGDIPVRDANASLLGTTSNQDIIVIAGGGIAIGPGSVGAALRYVHQGYSEIDGGPSGYAIDIAGAISFVRRLYLAMSLNSIAGEMRTSGGSGARDEVPWQLRLSGSYLYPLEESTELVRRDPSGLPTERPGAPRAYLLGIGELRTSKVEPTVWTFAAEAVPLAITPSPGLRIGWNTRIEQDSPIEEHKNEFSFGVFVTNLSIESFSNLRVDCAWHSDHLTGDGAYHLSLTKEF